MRLGFAAVFAIVLTCLLAACSRSGQDTVVVHVFRDGAAPSAPVLARRIAYFQSLRVRTPNRRLIIVAEDAGDYAGKLAVLGATAAPELVILNSERDGERNPKLREELAYAIDLGTDGHRCLAFVPSWVSGDERLAAQMLLNTLLSD